MAFALHLADFNFHQTAFIGKLDGISHGIKQGFDVNLLDNKLNTPLHMASANNQPKAALLLLENGANINACNSFGWTPLMQASRHGHLDVVSLLLQRGAAVNLSNKFGMTALGLASVKGDLNTVKCLIQHGAEFEDDKIFESGQISPIMFAVVNGNDDAVKFFLNKSVNVNSSTPRTCITLLMAAVALDNASTAKILLERGAKLKAFNAADFSAYDIAITCNHTHVADILSSRPFGLKRGSLPCSDIMEATLNGDIHTVQRLLAIDDSKAKFVNDKGATPLMVAAMNGHLSIACLLIKYGADINSQDFVNGWSPLMQAIYHKQTQMAICLLNNGASIDIISTMGYTAPDLANKLKNVELMKYFARIQNDRLPVTPMEDSYAPSDTSKSENMLKQWWLKVFSPRSEKQKEETKKSQGFNTLSPLPPLPPIDYVPIYKEDPPIHDPMEEVMSRDLQSLSDILEGMNMKLSINCNEDILKKIPPGKKLSGQVPHPPESAREPRFISKMRDHPLLRAQTEELYKLAYSGLSKESISSGSSHQNSSMNSQNTSSKTVDLLKSLCSGRLSKILEKHGMKHLCRVLEKEEVDNLDAFVLLTPDSLLELRIDSPTMVNKIMNIIHSLKKNNGDLNSI